MLERDSLFLDVTHFCVTSILCADFNRDYIEVLSVEKDMLDLGDESIVVQNRHGSEIREKRNKIDINVALYND